MENKLILGEILRAVEKAESKHPDFPESLHKQMSILTEEVGEIAKAILDYEDADGDKDDIYQEVLDAGAVIIRMLKHSGNIVHKEKPTERIIGRVNGLVTKEYSGSIRHNESKMKIDPNEGNFGPIYFSDPPMEKLSVPEAKTISPEEIEEQRLFDYFKSKIEHLSIGFDYTVKVPTEDFVIFVKHFNRNKIQIVNISKSEFSIYYDHKNFYFKSFSGIEDIIIY